jgi:CheY-like chemotaxis protein
MDILLADDHKVRLAMRVLLEQTPGLTVVGEACNAQDLLAQTNAARPDLVLLDWALPGLHASGTLRTLHRFVLIRRSLSSAGGLKRRKQPLPPVPTPLSAKWTRQSDCWRPLMSFVTSKS